MRIFIQFSLLFTEILLAVIELAAGALILREYWRRKNQPHLFYMAASLLVMGLGNLTLFASDFFSAQGAVDYGAALVALYSYIILVGSLLYAFGFINLYAKRKKLWYAMSGLTALVFGVVTRVNVMEQFGQYIPAETVDNFLISYGYWILIHLITLFVAVSVYTRSRRENNPRGEADHMLLIGSGLSLSSALIAISILSVQATEFTSLVYLVLIFGTAYKYLGAVAVKNPIESIQMKPLQVITSSVTIKVLLACAMFYILFAFALMATVTHYFISQSIQQQERHIQYTLQNSSRQHEERHQVMAGISGLLATHQEGVDAILGNKSSVAELMKYAAENEELEIDLVGVDGSLLHTSHHAGVGNRSLADNDVVVKALEGESNVATVEIWEADVWSTVAASPVINSAGDIVGALLVSRPLTATNLPTCLSEQGLLVSGCGLVSADGETIFSAGIKVDELTISKFRSSIRIGSNQGRGSSLEFGEFFVRTYGEGPSESKDFYYAFVTAEDRDKSMLRVLSVVVLITVLFFTVFAFLLVFGMSLFLSPVMMLRKAAKELSQGNYDQSIDYDSSDEIGQLASAFNDMTETIKERTHRLDEKISEQRDALYHTAHEIRTPLNIFGWSLEMLRFGDVGPLNNEQMELVENMNQTNNRVRKLVNELLEVSRIEQGAVKMNRTDFQMEDLIEEVAGSFAVKLREKKIDFYWRRPKNTLPMVNADRDRVMDILTNLIGNSVKFTMDEGHIEVKLVKQEISGPSERAGEFLRVSVVDNGRGIPKREQVNIFRKFYRATNVLNEEIEGTGLGLYLAHKYVEMQGGEMWFISKEGEGTSFHFTLPLTNKSNQAS